MGKLHLPPRRLALAGAVLLAALSFWIILSGQPPTGGVTGVCRDQRTGQPAGHVRVWLDRQGNDPADDTGSDDSSNSGVAGDTTEVTNARGETQPPFGWKQDSAEDDGVDAAGAKIGSISNLEAESDTHGRFALAHVPVGHYRIHAEGSWSDEKEQSLTVADTQTSRLTLAIAHPAPSLAFAQTLADWLPEEDPVLGLHGTVESREVRLSLARADLDGLLGRDPLRLVRPGSEDDETTRPGLYVPVRHWTERLGSLGTDGSFYQRLHLGRLAPGLYRITARDENAVAVGWALVSRLALVRKSYSGHVLSFVTAIGSGRPLAGVSTCLYALGGGGNRSAPRLLRQARTGPDGLARLDATGSAPETQGVLVARAGSSVAAVSLELNSPGTSAQDDGRRNDTAAGSVSASPGALRSFLYTDRPLYRPGQTVFLKGICRWLTVPGPQVRMAGFSVPVAQPVQVDIRDAQNTLVSHLSLHTDDLGSWNAAFVLSSEALTGEYSVHAVLGNQTGDGSFAVAAYHKPEYQVTVAFGKDRYVRGDIIQATVTASYYFGAPVTGAVLHCQIERTGGEEGGDGEGDRSGEPLPAETLRLDDRGQAHLSVPTAGEPEGASDQQYTVTADVADPSGRSVEGTGTVTVGQGLFSLSLNAAPSVCTPGTPIAVSLSALKEGGVPEAGQAVSIKAGYESWTGDHEQISPLSAASLRTLPSGQAQWQVPARRTGLLLIQAVARDVRGNHLTAEATVWVAGTGEDIPAQYPDLAVVPDKPHYQVGQTVRLLVNTAHPGPTALVAVEGTTLYRAWTVPLRRRSTLISFVLTPDLAPGVTVSVCAIAHKQFLESRAPLAVGDPARVLQVSVQADAPRCHPGDPEVLRIRTQDARGRPAPAEVSVGVVDSSLYALRDDAGRSILEALQPDQGDSVDTENSCPQVYLGDVDKGDAEVKLRRRFPDTALWRPNVRTGSAGTATVRLTMPDTLTAWRVTCIGQTRDTAVGKGLCTLTVNKDLLVRLEAPAFLVAGDRSLLRTTLHNNTGAPLTAQVHLEAHGLQLAQAPTRNVLLPPGRPTGLSWRVLAPAPLPADVRVTVRAGRLSDGLEETVPVAPHGAFRDVWQAGSLLRRAQCQVTLEPGALPDSTRLDIRLAPTVSSALLPALDYLEAYPYGSTDATVSVLLPDVLLSGGGLAPAGLADSGRAARLREQVGRSLLRLYRFQHEDGGWGWWQPGQSDLWMTAYATWGLTLARDARFPVNGTLLGSAARATATLLAARKRSEDLADTPSDLALAALALAHAGRPAGARQALQQLDNQWRLRPDRVTHTDLAVAALAAHILGGADESRAQALMARLWAGRRRLGALAAWTVRPHPVSAGAAQNPPDAETTAWVLTAAQAITPADPRSDPAARWLMINRTGDHWNSTRATAIALLALTGYLQRAHEMQPNFDARLTVNGRLVRAVHFGSESLDRPDLLVSLPASALRSGRNDIGLEKVGAGRLFYTLDLHQCLPQPQPLPPPSLWHRLWMRLWHPEAAILPPSPSGVRVKRVYLRLTSRRSFLWEDTVPAPDTRFQTDDSLLVRLIIDCTRPASHVLVEEPIPAGCQVAEASGDEQTDWLNGWDYTDVRDDRIVFFLGDLTRGRHEIDYHLQARTPGSYDIMPTLVSGTFDPALHALGQAGHILVESP